MLNLIEVGLVAGLATGSIYALIALGYNLVLASSGVFNLAQGANVTIGIIGSYVLITRYGLPAPLVVLLMALAGGMLGLLAERIAVRPFMGTPRHLGEDTLVSTLGLGLAITAIVTLLFGVQVYPMAAYVPGSTLFVGSLGIEPIYIVMIAFTAFVALVTEVLLYVTSAGIIMRATISDREGAELMGVSVGRVIQLSFALSAALGAVSGFLIAPVVYVSVTAGANAAIYGFAALAVGGFGSFRGALVGGLLIGIVSSMIPVFFEPFWAAPIIFVALLIFLAFRPSGLFQRGGVGVVRDV